VSLPKVSLPKAIRHALNTKRGFYAIYQPLRLPVAVVLSARLHDNKTVEIPNAFSSNQIKGSLTPLNAQLNPICHLLALLGAHHILHVSRIRVNKTKLIFFSFD
jgi:hypothetical protein